MGAAKILQMNMYSLINPNNKQDDTWKLWWPVQVIKAPGEIADKVSRAGSVMQYWSRHELKSKQGAGNKAEGATVSKDAACAQVI